MALRRYNTNPRAAELNQMVSLSRGLLFAYTAGKSMGFINGTLADGSQDLVSRVAGVWNSTPSLANYEDSGPTGRVIGGPPISPPGADFISWTPPAGTTPWDVPTAGFACCAIVNIDTSVANSAIFKKRDDDLVANPGWGLYIGIGPTLNFHFSDGTTEIFCSGTTVPVAGQTYMIIGSYDKIAGRAKIWVDGKLENDVAASINSVNNSLPVQMFGPEGTAPEAAMEIAAGILWGRPLTLREVNDLANDPFIIFRWYSGRLDFMDIAGFGAIGGGYFMVF